MYFTAVLEAQRQEPMYFTVFCGSTAIGTYIFYDIFRRPSDRNLHILQHLLSGRAIGTYVFYDSFRVSAIRIYVFHFVFLGLAIGTYTFYSIFLRPSDRNLHISQPLWGPGDRNPCIFTVILEARCQEIMYFTASSGGAAIGTYIIYSICGALAIGTRAFLQ